ncbi:hypothetical protein ACFPM0_22790 [Pseudonocardia sulfidoxydans]|uniref:hypothetical protein n=1 Tax=Pseudonocardia sulfidoxydans TaxID=54011 RepID=UPI0036129955
MSTVSADAASYQAVHPQPGATSRSSAAAGPTVRLRARSQSARAASPSWSSDLTASSRRAR